MKNFNYQARKTANVIKVFLIAATASVVAIISYSCKDSGSSKDILSVPIPPALPSTASASSDSVYVNVDEMPVFPGGENELLKFIAANTSYPEEAKKKNIEGKVIVKFVVRTDGSVSDVSMVKGVDPLLDAEALRVVGSLPRFEKPAIADGREVDVQFMLPITFALR